MSIKNLSNAKLGMGMLSGNSVGPVANALAHYSPKVRLGSFVCKVRRVVAGDEVDIYEFFPGTDNYSLTKGGAEVDGSGETFFVITWYDQSGNGLDFEQTTATNQPGLVLNASELGYPVVDFDGTDNFLQQKIEDDNTGATFWPTNAGAAFNATNARFRVAGVDLSLFASAANDYVLIASDSAGKKVHGYIDIADTAEALTSLVSDDMSADNTGDWSLLDATLAFDTDHYKLTYVADTQHMWQVQALTALTLYKYTIDVKNGTLSSIAGTIQIIGGTTYGDINFTTSVSWQTITSYFVAADSSERINIFVSMPGAGNIEFRNFDVSEVTNVGTDGILIMSTKGGSTQSWTQQESGIDLNDIDSFEVVKSDFHAISTAFSVLMRVKPDDGQPASEESFGLQYIGVSEERKVRIAILTTGKLKFHLSSTGSDGPDETTDTAVFSNGATSWTYFAMTYDGSGPTGIIYVNGSSVASTTTGTLPSTLHDSPVKAVIGALATPGNYLAGYISEMIIFNTAQTAGQIWGLDKPI